MLAIVDTAFTGELLLAEADARAWGVVVLDVEAALELGDRTTMTAKQGIVTLQWLGQAIDVTVQVTPDPVRQRSRQDGEPVGLLGTGLLNSVVLTIDFPRRSVMLKTDE